MDKIIGITNAPDDVILAYLDEQSILVRAHGKYVGGHIVIYEDSQQIASGDLIDGREVEGTGTYDYNLTPVDGYSGYDDTKSYRLVIDGDEIDSVINSNITNLPIDALYIIAGLNGEMNVTSTIPDLANVSVSQTKTVTTKNYQTKKLDKSLLPDSVESGIKAANTKATNAMYAAQGAQDTANKAVSDAATAQSAANIAQTTANTAKSTAESAQTTANEAKILPNQYHYFSSLYSKSNNFLGWYSTYPSLEYMENDGYFRKSSWEQQPIANGDMPSKFFCRVLKRLDGLTEFLDMLLVLQYRTGNTWGVSGIAFAKDGRIYAVTSNSIAEGSAQGIQLVFSLPNKLFLNSSTANSTKKFRITVDDAGTLSATEVTDA